jgi:transposase InsO family protein
MPWRETDAMDQRIQFVVRALEEKANRSELCREFGISRKTGYKWLKRYGEVGSLQALVPKSRRPKHSPCQTSSEVEDRVEALRKKHGWGGGKLSCMLRREGIDLPAGTVDRVLRRRGLTGPAPDGRAALQRFERSTPNDLWQIDFKGPMQWQDAWSSTPLSVLDDHSRFVPGLAPLRSLTEEAAMPPLVACFEQYGLPTTILMDHGTPWWSTTNGHGLTRFSIRLILQGIRLIYGRIRHPQTQGKVERFHRTLKASFQHRGLPPTFAGFVEALAAFREEYNEIRPHEALAMEVPASRYQKSSRSYQPKPREWEYPEGSEVLRLNSAGCIEYRRGRYFVCEALAGERVRCQCFAQRVLVTYRHMEIREIDLEAGRTFPVVRPAN